MRDIFPSCNGMPGRRSLGTPGAARFEYQLCSVDVCRACGSNNMRIMIMRCESRRIPARRGFDSEFVFLWQPFFFCLPSRMSCTRPDCIGRDVCLKISQWCVRASHSVPMGKGGEGGRVFVTFALK